MKKKGIAVSVFMTGVFALTACGKMPDADQTTVLEEKNFTKTVIADGTVECADPEYIYAEEQLPIKDVLVKAGDSVKAGDVLCVLDTTSIENEIELQQASMELKGRSVSVDMASASHQLSYYKDGINSGKDSNLIAADAKVNQAQAAWATALKKYNDYKESLDMGTNRELLAADNAVNSAANSLQQAKSMQEEYKDKKDDENEHITKIMLEQAEDNVDSASLAYSQAVRTRDSVLRETDVALADLAMAAGTAQMDYLMAVNAKEAAVRDLKNAKQTSADSYAKAEIAGDMSVEEIKLAQLQTRLSDATIKASKNGTVTSVNKDQGELSTGILFSVEDITDLVVTARVEESDINSVQVGQKANVTLKTDASDVYEAQVTSIAPAATKNSAGKTDTSGDDAEYEVTLKVLSPDENIKIGMNTDVEITVFEEPGCYSVPDRAIYTDNDGNSFVYAVSKSGDVNKLSVDKGVSAGKTTVVSGSGLKDGVVIVNDASTEAAQ